MSLEPWYAAAYAAPALALGAAAARTARRAPELERVARASVVERLGDAVVVLDGSGRVAEVNAAALRLLARVGGTGRVIGRQATDVLGPLSEALLGASGQRSVDIAGSSVLLDVHTSELVDAQEDPVGRLVLARDVTDEASREVELARVSATVQEQGQTIERLTAEVAEGAVRDPLTGLHDRRHLEAVLPLLVGEASRTGTALSVAVLDADQTKAVTAQHGEPVAARVLRALAAELLAAVCPEDTVVRWGGGEFVVVMPGTGAAEAVRRTEELQRRCLGVRVWGRGTADAVPVPVGRVVGAPGGARASGLPGSAPTPRGPGGAPEADQPVLGLTLSAGVATAAPGRESAESLLEAADVALCEAKRLGGGRLRAAVSDPDGTVVPAQHSPSSRPPVWAPAGPPTSAGGHTARS